MALPIPDPLAAACRRDGREGWLDRLPGTLATVCTRWGLTVGPPYLPGGETAWVAPAQDGAGRPLALKLAWRHAEAEDEAAALRAWDGRGAVRLMRAEVVDGETAALLLERCVPGTTLHALPEPDQDAVVAGLCRQLWRAPVGDGAAGAARGFRPLVDMCDMWAAEVEAKPPALADPGLARAGLALFRSLPRDADRAVLLATDLHAGNILAAERAPWLAIDPKPYVGDPTYEPLQHMINCPERLADDARAFAGRMADLLELDRDRLLLWLFARCVQESPSWPNLAALAPRLAPA
jgi:streptomycin 6-kinase